MGGEKGLSDVIMTQISDRIQGFVMYGARGLSRDAENILQLTREQQEQLGRANRDEDDWQMVSDVICC